MEVKMITTEKFGEGYIAPGKVFDNIYFVGSRPASTHVIDTGEGLLVLDPGYREGLPLVLENMREVRLDPKDVRIILLSHGHNDHAAAAKDLAELSGAEIYLGEDDLKMVNGEEYYCMLKPEERFTPTRLLREGDHVRLGWLDILCLSTPGHTEGTLSFFFDVKDGERTLRAGMFGGAGTNTLNDEYMAKKNRPLSVRTQFLGSIDRLMGERVDLFLGNHVRHNDTMGRLERSRGGERDAFVDSDIWQDFLQRVKDGMLKIMGGSI
jgi:metallo-beta-lactamase class B